MSASEIRGLAEQRPGMDFRALSAALETVMDGWAMTPTFVVHLVAAMECDPADGVSIQVDWVRFLTKMEEMSLATDRLRAA